MHKYYVYTCNFIVIRLLNRNEKATSATNY